MKSFNSSADESDRRVHAWSPADFSRPAEAPLLSTAEQLLAILGPIVDHPQSGVKRADEIRLIRAGDAAQKQLRTWDPGDMGTQANILDDFASERSQPNGDSRSNSSQAGGTPVFPNFIIRHPEKKGTHNPEPLYDSRQAFDEKKMEEILSEARTKSEKIIQNAQYSAGELIKKSTIEAQQAREEGFLNGQKEGYEKGFEQGQKEGYTEGQAAARAETASAVQAAQNMIAELAVWRDEMVAQSEESVVNMIRQIARLMFGEGIQMDKNALQTYLNEVMETTRSLGDLNIFLNPDDYNRLDSAWAEYHTQIRGSRVRTIGSSSILPGGCYVKGQMGTVDARVETKLDAVMETLKDEQDPGVSE